MDVTPRTATEGTLLLRARVSTPSAAASKGNLLAPAPQLRVPTCRLHMGDGHNRTLGVGGASGEALEKGRGPVRGLVLITRPGAMHTGILRPVYRSCCQRAGVAAAQLGEGLGGRFMLVHVCPDVVPRPLVPRAPCLLPLAHGGVP